MTDFEPYENSEIIWAPSDFGSPDWANLSKVHEWKRYVTSEVQRLWPTFTVEQRKAIARQAQWQADQEEWD